MTDDAQDLDSPPPLRHPTKFLRRFAPPNTSQGPRQRAGYSTSERVRPGTWRTNGPMAAGFAQLAGRVTHTAPPAIFTVLGRGRRTFWGWLAFAGTLMPFGSLPRGDSELVILRVAKLRDSHYEIAHHRQIARRAGLTAEQVEQLISATPETPYFSERQMALIAATDELIADDDLSDESWGRLHRHLDDRGCVEFLLLAGHYRMLATTLETLRVKPDQPK